MKVSPYPRLEIPRRIPRFATIPRCAAIPGFPARIEGMVLSNIESLTLISPSERTPLAAGLGIR
eukprot:576525-Amorphochlora_amoeboformis.AAC.1